MTHSCFLCGKRKSNERLSFFHFPKKKEERERWISLCRPYVNLDLMKVTRNTRICQRHFTPHSIHCKRERPRLRHRAAPSIFFEKRVSYRKCVPLSECDDVFNGEVLHQNHFLMNGVSDGVTEMEETRLKYYDAESYTNLSDFENTLDCVTVDTAEILSVPASEFVEVQMDADSQLINENDSEYNVNDIENISIPPDNIYDADDDEVRFSDRLIDDPQPPNCIVISSDESSDESSSSEFDDTVHNDHTYCEPSTSNSSESSRNNCQHFTLSSDHVDSTRMSVMRVSLAHYKNSTRDLQVRLRTATKKLENLEHAIHELGLANKISMHDMETLLFHINPR